MFKEFVAMLFGPGRFSCGRERLLAVLNVYTKKTEEGLEKLAQQGPSAAETPAASSGGSGTVATDAKPTGGQTSSAPPKVSTGLYRNHAVLAGATIFRVVIGQYGISPLTIVNSTPYTFTHSVPHTCSSKTSFSTSPENTTREILESILPLKVSVAEQENIYSFRQGLQYDHLSRTQIGGALLVMLRCHSFYSKKSTSIALLAEKDTSCCYLNLFKSSDRREWREVFLNSLNDAILKKKAMTTLRAAYVNEKKLSLWYAMAEDWKAINKKVYRLSLIHSMLRNIEENLQNMDISDYDDYIVLKRLVRNVFIHIDPFARLKPYYYNYDVLELKEIVKYFEESLDYTFRNFFRSMVYSFTDPLEIEWVTEQLSVLPQARQQSLNNALIEENWMLRVAAEELYFLKSKFALHGLVQFYIKLCDQEKIAKLIKLLGCLDFNQAVIFARNFDRAGLVKRELVHLNYQAIFIYSDEQRLAYFKEFEEGHKKILVVTDSLGIGSDFKGVNIVINFDMPDSVEVYLRRVGRFERLGTKGLAITFVELESDSDILHQVREIFEVDIKEMPEEINASTYMP